MAMSSAFRFTQVRTQELSKNEVGLTSNVVLELCCGQRAQMRAEQFLIKTNKVREKKGLTRKEYRHETHMMCSVCGVHLCITKDRDCFRKFHTQSIYWT